MPGINYKLTKINPAASIAISLSYATITYLLLPYSYDYYSHLETLSYYANEDVEFLKLLVDNNIFPIIFKILPWINPALIIEFSYYIVSFILAYYTTYKKDPIIAFSVLWAAMIVVLNTNRQVIALITFFYIIDLEKLKKLVLIPLCIFLHNSVLFAIVAIYKIRLSFLYIGLFVFIFGFPYVSPYLKYGYSTNDSEIQGNLVPSFIILLLTMYSCRCILNVEKYLHLLFIVGVMLCVLIEFTAFNQFIYLSRVLWIMTMLLHLHMVKIQPKNFNIMDLFIFSSTSIIFGFYHFYVNIILRINAI
jgi:hypothetical protein